MREVSANILPNQGMFGAKYALRFTIPQFEAKIRPRLAGAADPGHVPSLYDLFGCCLQGQGTAKWELVITEQPVAMRDVASFFKPHRDYLECVQGLKQLGNCIIRQLRLNRKPPELLFEDY